MNEIDLVLDGDEAFVNGELEGIDTSVSGGHLVQKAYTNIEREFLRNAEKKLNYLRKSGIAPEPIELLELRHETIMLTQFLGKSEPVTDEITFRRNCALLLWTLKKHGVRHGDITTKNIIVKNNKPMLIDFHQSKFDNESGPDKRPEGDAYNLWEAALELSPDTSRHIRKWRAIRPFIDNRGWIIDLGCAQGDYLLFAFVEPKSPMMFWGYDQNKDDLDIAQKLWPGSGFGFHLMYGDITEREDLQSQSTLLLSVYAHVVKSHGKQVTDNLVEKAIKESSQFFFETQLYGDGPGPEFFKTDDDVFRFLKQFGKVEKLVTIPVHGRDASRTVWRVT